MKAYIEEKIGNPDLFTGRKNELAFLLKWTEKIKKRLSPSRALVSRRKTGKTAILQRLFNIVYERNDQIIPFYYEVRETKQWAVEFCKDFFISFIYQYLAFRTRKPEYLQKDITKDFPDAIGAVTKEGFDYLADSLKSISRMVDEEKIINLWDAVRDYPRGIAHRDDMRVLQIIDEFQYLNRKIYRDKKAEKNLMNDFAQGYMSTAEYKNAPLLIAGSWVGWLMGDITKMPARFKKRLLKPMSEAESLEMIFKYSALERTAVTEESAHLIASLCEGNPFYISALMRSDYPGKNLTTANGVLETLKFETLDEEGDIRESWMEYIGYAFSDVNDRNAKNMVLYLAKNRDREITRDEIREKLVPEMDDGELEKKLKTLVNCDIIEQGRTNFDYRGVQDNIFDKVFRGVYQKEIESFDPAEITNEYKAMFEDIQKKYRKLQGSHSYLKGKFAEFTFILKLTYRAQRENDLFCSMMENLQDDFRFTEYESVWSWSGSPVYKKDIQIDIFARAGEDEYTLIGEIKNRKETRFSKEEAEKFKTKAETLMEIETVQKAVLFVFSLAGFTEDALTYFKENRIAWTTDAKWLEPEYS